MVEMPTCQIIVSYSVNSILLYALRMLCKVETTQTIHIHDSESSEEVENPVLFVTDGSGDIIEYQEHILDEQEYEENIDNHLVYLFSELLSSRKKYKYESNAKTKLLSSIYLALFKETFGDNLMRYDNAYIKLYIESMNRIILLESTLKGDEEKFYNALNAVFTTAERIINFCIHPIEARFPMKSKRGRELLLKAIEHLLKF